MAVDTRDKRASCLGFVLPLRLVLPNPDATIDAGDRTQLGYSYRGFADAGAGAGIGTRQYLPIMGMG